MGGQGNVIIVKVKLRKHYVSECPQYCMWGFISVCWRKLNCLCVIANGVV